MVLSWAGGGIKRYPEFFPRIEVTGVDAQNPQILPWDSDLDLQVSEETIHFLAKYYNMTEYHFSLPGLSSGRNYLLEINPHYTIRGTEDKLNVIDARWIDTDTGLFIDVSTVRTNWTAVEDGVEGALMCKDRHHYLVSKNGVFNTRDTPLTMAFAYRKKTFTHSATASSRAYPSRSHSSTPGF
jgi:phosphorylcholine metabolism protein LicD